MMMMAITTIATIAALLCARPLFAYGDDQHADMKHRGNEAMGFDQDKTTHHFTLTADGGAIAVSVNDAADTASRDRIRMHLTHIADAFGRGEFDKPVATHAEEPPGVETMRRLKARIRYRVEETPLGGRVRIVTSDADALGAIHAFLRYQITEHKTGDPLEMNRADRAH